MDIVQNIYCNLCGRNHSDTTGGCMQPNSIHIPAKTVYTNEAHEVCPTCNGLGYIPSSLIAALKRIGAIFK